MIDRFDPSTPLASKAAIYALVKRLGAGDFELIVAEIAQHQNARLRYAMLSVLAERWADLDPRAVVRLAIEGQWQGGDRSTFLKAGFDELTRVSPDEARELALLTDGKDRRNAVLPAMFASLAETDPQLGLRWLDDRSLVPAKDFDRTTGEFFESWAEIDPAAAARGALDCASEWNVGSIATMWARVDPEALAEWAAKLETPKLRALVVDELIEVTVAQDGGALAKKLIAELFPGEVPYHVLSSLGQELAKHDVGASLSWLSSSEIPKENMVNVGRNLVTRFTRDHPERIPELLAAFTDEKQRRTMIDWIASKWGPQDAAAATAWAESLEPGVDQDTAFFALVQYKPELSARLKDPAIWKGAQISKIAAKMSNVQGSEATKEWINQLPTSSLRINALQGALRTLADDPLAAAAFVAQLDFGQNGGSDFLRASKLNRIAKQWAQTEPETAARWAEENGLRAAANDIRGDEVERLVGKGKLEEAVTQFHGHIEALALLPEGTPKYTREFSGAAAKIAHNWTRQDPEASANWFNSVADESIRNGAMYQVTHTWARFDREAALAWTLNIDNEKTREFALRGTFDQWAGFDPESARAALGQITLSASELEAVMKEFPEEERGSAP